MDFRPGELVVVRAGSHWPELVGRIQMIHAQGMPVWLAVLDVDTGDVLGVPTTHVIGKLENLDPAPSDWVEPEGPMESLALKTGRGSSTPTNSKKNAGLRKERGSDQRPWQSPSGACPSACVPMRSRSRQHR